MNFTALTCSCSEDKIIVKAVTALAKVVNFIRGKLVKFIFD